MALMVRKYVDDGRGRKDQKVSMQIWSCQKSFAVGRKW